MAKIKTKEEERKSLYDKAWKLMSLFIRQSAADSNGITVCYTCGKKNHYKETNAGHYIHNKLDFDFRNLKNQCVYCNKYLSGNLGIYAERLIKEYGIEWLEKLRSDAQRKGNNYSIQELKVIISMLEANLNGIESKSDVCYTDDVLQW